MFQNVGKKRIFADPADQQHLLTLAEFDSGVRCLQHIAKTLPQHARIAELMTARQAIADDLVVATTRAQGLELSVHRAESNLAPVWAQLKRGNREVDDGSVTDPRVLHELVEEVEHIKQRITELGDAELDLIGQLEEAAVGRDGLAARKKNVGDELHADVATHDAEVGKLSGEAKVIASSRTSEAKKVPTPLLTLYGKIRAHSSLGVAKLHCSQYSGCQLELAVSDLDTYRKAPQNEVLQCVECDRISVRTADSGL